MMRYTVLLGLLWCFTACHNADVKTKIDPKSVTENSLEVPDNKMEKKIPNYIDLNFVTGRFDPATHEMMSKISRQHADRDNLYMHKEAYLAFQKMHAAAKANGIDLIIKSAARNFDYQGGIWGRKWRGETLLEDKINAAKEIDSDLDRAKEIMKFSSMPGTSRHHWGTDIDMNNFTNEYFAHGKGKQEYDWLNTHANDFGFYQAYTQKSDGRTGYEEEKWHWSYMPIAFYCQVVIENELNNKDISGFPGHEQVERLDVKKNYIFGINNYCLDYGTN